MRNVIYYDHIERVGGVSTYVYELCKKYHKTKDITIYYLDGDIEQINRLRHYVRVRQYVGEDIECDVFITNYGFNYEIISHFKANRYIQVIHADYVRNRVRPKAYRSESDLFDLYVCVSEIAKKSYKELCPYIDESKFLVSHNPLNIDEVKPTLMIGSFTRLSWEKGEKRMEALINKLDATDISYTWFIYTNSPHNIESKNVCYMPSKLDVISDMANMDIVAQLSDCEGDNYTTKEAKSVGCKMLVTGCPTFYENNIIGKDDIVLGFDLENIDEVIERIRQIYLNKKAKQTTWKPIEDKYNDVLIDSISNYEKERNMKVKVKAIRWETNLKDSQVDRPRELGEEWEVTKERLEQLQQCNMLEVQVLDTIDEVVCGIQEPKVKKAVRKTTKK